MMGTLATSYYRKLAAFCKDPPDSYRIMNSEGKFSDCINKERARAWLEATAFSGGANAATQARTALANLAKAHRGVSQLGTNMQPRPFIVTKGFALFLL